MGRSGSRILFVALALASLPATAEVYRWVDSTGKVNFSDTPPPGGAKGVSRSKEADPPVDSQSYATRRAAENFPVTLYTAPDCVAECKQARDLLNRRGVPFSEKMVQKPEDFAELKQLVGDTFIPVLKVGKQVARGFLAESYNNLLDLAGYPASAPLGSKPSGGLAP